MGILPGIWMYFPHVSRRFLVILQFTAYMSLLQWTLPWTPSSCPPQNTDNKIYTSTITLTITLTVIYWNCLLITLSWSISSVSITKKNNIYLTHCWISKVYNIRAWFSIIIWFLKLAYVCLYIYMYQVKAELICIIISI